MPEKSLDTRGLFDLTGRVVVITGGAGLLGREHAEAVAECGGIPVLVDLDEARAASAAGTIADRTGAAAVGFGCDITHEAAVARLRDRILARFGRIDVLINNAANNPKVEDGNAAMFSRLETMPLSAWNGDLAVGLTGAFLCSRVIGAFMAEKRRGVIINIASDLAVIAPDQRLYRAPAQDRDQQFVKPVTYSVVKTGLVGLTRYLATYWAEDGVRVNAVSPGGVANGQPEDFVARLANLIPMGRMAQRDEFRGVIQFLCSDASSYMTGQNLVLDGGRTAW